MIGILKRIILPCVMMVVSCGGKNEETGCPAIAVLKGAERASYFKEGIGANELSYQVRLLDAMAVCEVGGDGIKIRLSPLFNLVKGMAGGETAEFEYFIAAIKKGEVVAKSVFTVKVQDFKDDVRQIEDGEVNITIPPAEDRVPPQLYLGLQMGRDQLDYNRSEKLWLN